MLETTTLASTILGVTVEGVLLRLGVGVGFIGGGVLGGLASSITLKRFTKISWIGHGCDS
jgi:hypothetical protein